MFEDIRSYLSYLEDKGQLLRVKDEVDVKYEIAAGIRKTSDIEGPALLFESVKGYPGWRVLGGLFATHKLVALGLGVPQEKMLERYLTLMKSTSSPMRTEVWGIHSSCLLGHNWLLKKDNREANSRTNIVHCR